MNRFSGLATLSLFLMILFPPSINGALWFDSDFEQGMNSTDWTSNQWSGTPSIGFMEMTPEIPFTENRSIKGTYDGADKINGNTQKPSIYRSWTKTNHIFVRFATRTSPGFKYCETGGSKMVRFQDFTAPALPKLWIYNWYGKYGIHVEGPYDFTGNYVLSSGIAPSSSSWDQVELEWKLNTPGQSNGLIRLWVNGALGIEQLNKAYIGPTDTSQGFYGLNPASYLISGAQIYQQCGLGNIYYDRFAAGDTRIGMVTNGQLPDTVTPAAPTNLTAVAKSTSQIDLSWKDNSSNDIGFLIEKKFGTANWANINTIPVLQTSYSVSGLAANRTYSFRVRAINSGDCFSAYSNEDSATTSNTRIGGATESVARTGQFTVNSRNGEVKFTLPGTGSYRLSVYDLAGRKVWKQMGLASFAGTNYAVASVQNIKMEMKLKDGVYVAKLVIHGKQMVQRFTIIR